MELLMRFRLKLRRSDGTYKKTSIARRRRIVSLARGPSWTEAILEVLYYCDGTCLGNNQGTYTTVDDLLMALAAFTEPELVLSFSPPTPNSTHAHIEAPSAMFAEEL